MISAYPKMYLEAAADNLGTMLDCAVNHFGYDPDLFMDMFIHSGCADQFGLGSSRFILGMSGRELCNEVYYRATKKELDGYRYEDPFVSKSREFWAGWILAKYQWYSCQTFERILDSVKVSDLIRMYYPLHEAPEEKTFEVLDKQLAKNGALLINQINEQYEVVNVRPYNNIYRSNFNSFDALRNKPTANRFNIDR